MNTNGKKFLAPSNGNFSLKDFDTKYDGDLEKEEGKLMLQEIKKQLSTAQEKLYAAQNQSVLLIFQAMDAAGKDSAIEHVMSGINPQGCKVYSFKAPNTTDYQHDFLWRHVQALPEKGIVGIHNRSHYENVLVCKVHPTYVLKERLPGYDDVEKIDHKFWKNRYKQIRNFEQHLVDNGTVVIKFFLHVSKEEQKQRFLDRINDPSKNWKFAVGDLAERKHWSEYQQAYEDAIGATATEDAPWYIIPADKKWFARLAIAEIIVDTLKGLALEFPTLPKEKQDELLQSKQQLMEE
jgi:PPK2 family polyphosphate:nucleotide phosphotransferase